MAVEWKVYVGSEALRLKVSAVKYELVKILIMAMCKELDLTDIIL